MELTEFGYWVVDITPFTKHGRKRSHIPKQLEDRFLLTPRNTHAIVDSNLFKSTNSVEPPKVDLPENLENFNNPPVSHTPCIESAHDNVFLHFKSNRKQSLKVNDNMKRYRTDLYKESISDVQDFLNSIDPQDALVAWKTILDGWRRHKLILAFKRFCILQSGLKLKSQNLSSISFNKLSVYLQSKQFVQSSVRLISRIEKWNNLYNNIDRNVTNGDKVTPGRTLLSAFMVVAHTDSIMDGERGPMEINVISSAELLLKDLEKCLDCVKDISDSDSKLNYSLLDDFLLNIRMNKFVKSWERYYNSFQGWKEKDKDSIIQSLIAHFLASERLWLSIREQLHADLEWSSRISSQQSEVVDKLTKFGEDALDKLAEARSKLHEEMEIEMQFVMGENISNTREINMPSTPKRINGNNNDNIGSYSSSVATSPQTFPSLLRQSLDENNRSTILHLDSVHDDKPISITTSPTLTPKRTRINDELTSPTLTSLDFEKFTPSPLQSPVTSKGVSLLRKKLDEKYKNNEIKPTNLFSNSSQLEELTSIQSKQKSVESKRSIDDSFLNMKIAHELILDPDFTVEKIDELKGKSIEVINLEKEVRAQMKKAWFDKISSQFENDNFQSLIEILLGIKENLLAVVIDTDDITKSNSKSLQLINDVIDIDLIKQQIASVSNYQPKELIESICKLMLSLCAPVRDEAIKEIKQSKSYSEGFKKLIDISEIIKTDSANFKLQVLKPILRQQAVTYEREKFEDQLKSSNVSLNITKEWLRCANNSVSSKTEKRNPENIPQMNLTKFKNVFDEAFLDLIFDTKSSLLLKPDYPETLELDRIRLNQMQNEICALTIVSALIIQLISSITVIKDNKSLIIEIKKNIMLSLEDKNTDSKQLGLMVIQTIEGTILKEDPNNSYKLTDKQRDIIHSASERILNTQDAVFSLINRRIRTIFKIRLENNVFKLDKVVSLGLEYISQELDKLSLVASTLSSFNREVYAPYYDSIIIELLK